MGATMFTFLPISGGCLRRRFSSRLPTVGQGQVLRPRQDDPDVLDGAGAVKFGVGGALVGGAGGR